MKKIDLIALDLDGTALNPQNQVSPATADAVRRARESGIHVVVSTGRICGEARDFALMLGTDDQMVTSGGATLSSVSQERCTMRMSMPWEAAVRASAVVERIGMITMVYVGETLLSAIKEILDRTVGKGVMLGGEQTEVQPVEIVFRIVDDTNSP